MPAGRAVGTASRRSNGKGERGKSALGIIKRQRHKPRTADRRFREVLKVFQNGNLAPRLIFPYFFLLMVPL